MQPAGQVWPAWDCSVTSRLASWVLPLSPQTFLMPTHCSGTLSRLTGQKAWMPPYRITAQFYACSLGSKSYLFNGIYSQVGMLGFAVRQSHSKWIYSRSNTGFTRLSVYKKIMHLFRHTHFRIVSIECLVTLGSYKPTSVK